MSAAGCTRTTRLGAVCPSGPEVLAGATSRFHDLTKTRNVQHTT